jgi:hypothetical protein
MDRAQPREIRDFEVFFLITSNNFLIQLNILRTFSYAIMKQEADLKVLLLLSALWLTAYLYQEIVNANVLFL